jgi:hypothetical protein
MGVYNYSGDSRQFSDGCFFVIATQTQTVPNLGTPRSKSLPPGDDSRSQPKWP